MLLVPVEQPLGVAAAATVLPRRRRCLLLRHSTARSAPIHHRRQPCRTIAGNKLAGGYGGAAPRLDAFVLLIIGQVRHIMHARDRAAKDKRSAVIPKKQISSLRRPPLHLHILEYYQTPCRKYRKYPLRSCLVLKEFCTVFVTSNFRTHAQSIKCC